MKKQNQTTAKELLSDIVNLNRAIESQSPDVETIVPCLVGPTGAGKTTIARTLAAELGLPLVRLLLDSMYDVEILGIPRVVDGKTVWTTPDWVLDQPFFLLIDELDKARDEEIGVVLTLLAEKTVRNHRIPPGSVICCAMQPVEPERWQGSRTREALAARLNFIPVSYDAAQDYIREKWGVTVPFLSSEPFDLPILPHPSPRQVEYGLATLSYVGVERAKEILRGVLQPAHIAGLIESWESRELPTDAVVRAVTEHPELLEKMAIPELVAIAGPVMVQCSPDVVGKLLYEVYTRGSDDDTAALHRSIYAHLKDLGEEIDIFGGASMDEVITRLNDWAQRVANKWEEGK